MDKITNLVSFLAALSIATERITEIVKGLPLLSGWLAVERPANSTGEALRKASVQIIALLAGALVTYLVREPLAAKLQISDIQPYMYVVFGAMASGGSGFWNSALDILREVNRQKQIATENLKAEMGSPAGAVSLPGKQ
jgi:hypothetical protein